MSIVVNTNVSSINAQRQLNKVGKSLDTAMERLASGLRINHAGDDAAGLAISNGLDSQVRGLTQAVRNANDGLSVAGVAEGALNTQVEILQRIRELSVQAANDINSGDNRSAIQDEIDAQVSELTRLGNTTTFNGINLMDGSFSNKQLQVGAYASQAISMTLGDFRSSGMGAMATTSGQVAVVGANQLGAVSNTAPSGGAGALLINNTVIGASQADGVSFANSTSSAIAKAAAINASASTTGVTATANAAKYSSVTNMAVGGPFTTATADSFKINGTEVLGVSGIVVQVGDSTGTLVARINQFSNTTGVVASVSANKMVLTAADGRNITTTVSAGAGATITGAAAGTYTGTVSVSSNSDITLAGTQLTDIGFLATQTSAVATGNLTTVDVTTQTGANNAITSIDSALKKVNTMLAGLGAITNRLNNTINNIQVTVENLSASESRIKDADFATETANMTRAQIIQQSSIAVLTQANSRPQSALTLLGQ